MDLGLRDVHVLITGASGGIGLETANLFLEQGAKVTLHGRSNIEPLESLKSQYTSRTHIVKADLTNEAEVARIWNSSKASFGPVQIVIVNHGIWPEADAPVADMTLEQWNRTLQANLSSSFLVCREYLRGLRGGDIADSVRDKASMVLIGSTAGKFGEAMHADYAVSKSAMMYGLTLSLKNEIVKIAPKGRVNSVAPGWVYTPMAAEALKDPQVIYQTFATTSLMKIATSRDVANQVAVLSSPTLSGHVTGQVVMVDGGLEGDFLNKPEEFENFAWP